MPRFYSEMRWRHKRRILTIIDFQDASAIDFRMRWVILNTSLLNTLITKDLSSMLSSDSIFALTARCIALHRSALLKPSESVLSSSQVVLFDICVHNNKGNRIIAKLIIDFVISIPLRRLLDDISVLDDWADWYIGVQWHLLPMPV